jgi:hypothetical protein
VTGFGKLSPETVKGYAALGGAGEKTGRLGAKTRELIALAVDQDAQSRRFHPRTGIPQDNELQVGSRAMNEDMSFVAAGNYGAKNYGSKSVSAE